MDTMLYLPPPKAEASDELTPKLHQEELKPIQEVKPPRSTRRGINSDRIRQVRDATCYPALRSLVTIAATWGYCAAGILFLFGVVGVFFPGTLANPEGATVAQAWVGIFASVITAVLTMAGREAAFVVVDIADVLIATSAESRRKQA